MVLLFAGDSYVNRVLFCTVLEWTNVCVSMALRFLLSKIAKIINLRSGSFCLFSHIIAPLLLNPPNPVECVSASFGKRMANST